MVIRMESFSLHHKNNESPSPAAGNHPQSLLRLRWSTDKPPHTHVHVHTFAEFAHLIQLPVELGGPESVDLREISSEQEHQAAVVDIQRVMVAVHLCSRKMRNVISDKNNSSGPFLSTPRHSHTAV